MKKHLLLLALITSSCTFAETNKCTELNTQSKMNACVSSELSVQNEKLNTVISNYRKLFESKNEEKMLVLFNNSNASWFNYLESHCLSTSSIYLDGSIYNFSFLSCKKTLTKKRIKELELSYKDTTNILELGSP